MGSGQSQRDIMGDRDESTAQGDANGDEESSDLATILSYLIRSGQVRIIPSDGDSGGDSDDSDFGMRRNMQPPKAISNPDLSQIEKSEFKQEVLTQSGQCKATRCHLPGIVHKREVGRMGNEFCSLNSADCCRIGASFLPNISETVAHYRNKAFCGKYSQSGDIFMTACQDQNIRIYDTTQGQFREFHKINARDVGWSVIDTAFSPDGQFICYSSWSDSIHLCSIYGDSDIHTALPLCPRTHSFCIFSLAFSLDNREILGGANDGHLYVYDREKNERTLKIDAHDDDINSVSFADESSQILFSGADDGLIKVWDRRTLSEEEPQPVGVLAGHADGITYLDSKGDGRYLISNCKDQTIKLWDMRKFSSQEAQVATKKAVSRQSWDYRWQQVPKKVLRRKKLEGDSSLMTYAGHSVQYTLVRCHFSPQHTTAQRYIYTGCAVGNVVIYDVLSGRIVSKLDGHKACVRDVSWHPYEHSIVSTSWDGDIKKWVYHPKRQLDSSDEEDNDGDDSDRDSDVCDEGPRRSKRLRHNPFRRFVRL